MNFLSISYQHNNYKYRNNAFKMFTHDLITNEFSTDFETYKCNLHIYIYHDTVLTFIYMNDFIFLTLFDTYMIIDLNIFGKKVYE